MKRASHLEGFGGKSSLSRRTRRRALLSAGAIAIGFLLAGAVLSANISLAKFQIFADPTGYLGSFTTQPFLDTNNAFFQNLGTNGRSCVSCHQPSDAWTVTPPRIRERFEESQGLDPIFRTVDGSNCNNLDVSTVEARRSAYSLLLNRGLIRIELTVPAGAEYSVESVDNPYGCGSKTAISVYRRPLPAANLNFLATVMWDGRETFKGNTILQDLAHQAMDATLGHAQAAHSPTDAQLESIVEFETALFTAQLFDRNAGSLHAKGANGGPVAISKFPFFLGINDPLGGNPTGAPFNPEAFDIFQAWADLDRHRELRADDSEILDPDTDTRERKEAREAAARGESLFNTLPIAIKGVAGINDVLKQDVVMGTCTTCHDTPNVGDHSLSVPLNIGINDASRRTPDMPLITLKCTATGEKIKTLDPGRALISGKCADIGKTKGPILRGLAARAPYFHNGSAATLLDVVDFYDERFNLNLTEQEKSDLVAFLRSL